MKVSSLIALGGLVAAVGTAQSQTVTLYGMVDAGFENVSNVAAAGGGSLQRMPSNTGMLPSRLGMRGTEDLGGGLSAIYTLEMGLGVDTGSSGQGGRLFGRQSTVGLSGSWGAITVGRQWTMLFWSLIGSDIVGPSIYGLGSLDAYIPNSRIDNSIAYRGKFGDVSLGATYSAGRDAAGAPPAIANPGATNCAGENGADSKACREYSLMFKYDPKDWGVALGYDRINGGTAATFAGLTSSSRSDSRLLVNGYVNVSNVKIGGGVIRRNNEGAPANPKSDLWYIGASYPVTPAFTLDGTLAKLDNKTGSDFDATLLAVRGLYKLSKRTTLYAQVGNINNGSSVSFSVSGGAPGSNPVAGGSQTGTMVGINHSF